MTEHQGSGSGPDQQDASPTQPAGTVYGPPQPQPPSTPNLGKLAAPVAGAIGAILIVVGSFMPWGVIQSVFGTITIAGTEGDGKITMVAGVVLLGGAALTAAVRHLWLRIVQTVIAAGTMAIALYETANVTSGVEEATSDVAIVSVGAGIYVLLFGATVTLAAATVDTLRRR